MIRCPLPTEESGDCGIDELSAGRSDGLAKHRLAHGLRSSVMAKSLKKKRVVRQKMPSKKRLAGSPSSWGKDSSYVPD